MTKPPKNPVLFDLEQETARAASTTAPSPSDAPAVPDFPNQTQPQGRAMQTLATLGARRMSWLAKLFWGALSTLIGVMISIAAWDFMTGLLARNAVLGYAVTALVGLVALALFGICFREVAAFGRLRRLDSLQKQAASALAGRDLEAARQVADAVQSLYARREDLQWGLTRFAERRAEIFDADALLGLIETEILSPVDRAAEQEIEAAARQVATVTAIVPLAFADVIAALTANLRMIRRIAELYGGRSGTLGNWRLTRTVFTHLVATGAVAVGDDLIGSIAGGGVVSKVSRRFGEGVVNGALTARVGVAAIEVCRPVAFAVRPRPSVTGLVKRALTGLFGG
jgi:putative membrane protein